MKLLNIVVKDAILPNLNATERDEAIAEVVDALVSAGAVSPELRDEFFQFVDQILKVSNTLMTAAQELQNLAETSFGGAEAQAVIDSIAALGEEEWKADRMQRSISKHMYDLEQELDPITINFYEKMLHALSAIANNAENTGDLLRVMIVKG